LIDTLCLQHDAVARICLHATAGTRVCWTWWVVGACRWRGPGGAVISARGRVKVVDDCHLVINAVDKSDSGNYTCLVSNVAATKAVSVALTVAGAC